jgi:hypothetical protein
MSQLVYDPKRRVMIPAGLAACGAGKDAYLRKLVNHCDCCGAKFVLDTSDSPENCAECFELAGIENEIVDGGATLEERADEIRALHARILANGGEIGNSGFFGLV